MRTESIHTDFLHKSICEPSAIWTKENTAYIHHEVRRKVITPDPDVIHDITRDVQSKIFVQKRHFNRSFLKSVIGTTVVDFYRKSSSNRRLIEKLHAHCTESSTVTPEQVIINLSVLNNLRANMSQWQFEALKMMAAGYSQQEVFDSIAKNHCESFGDFRTKLHRLRVFLHSKKGQANEA
jgi:hypothetical protein